eukprot:1195608-Prorocentrum_minimum.AAC.6
MAARVRRSVIRLSFFARRSFQGKRQDRDRYHRSPGGATAVTTEKEIYRYQGKCKTARQSGIRVIFLAGPKGSEVAESGELDGRGTAPAKRAVSSIGFEESVCIAQVSDTASAPASAAARAVPTIVLKEKRFSNSRRIFSTGAGGAHPTVCSSMPTGCCTCFASCGDGAGQVRWVLGGLGGRAHWCTRSRQTGRTDLT